MCKAPWGPADAVEEVGDLARHAEASFAHVKWSDNLVTDYRAKQDVTRHCLEMQQRGAFLSLFCCVFSSVTLLLSGPFKVCCLKA